MKLLVVIGYCDKDLEQMHRLLDWLEDLGRMEENPCLLVRACQVKEEEATKIREKAERIFRSAKEVSTQFQLKDERWPIGPNWMFETALRALIREAVEPKPWIWLEPDCVPMRSTWLNEIETTFDRVRKPFMGQIIEPEKKDLPQKMLSGVAVYPSSQETLNKLLRVVVQNKGRKAWDVAMSDLVVPFAHNCGLFWNFWGQQGMPPTFTQRKEKNTLTLDHIPRVVSLFHRCKDGSLIDILRKGDTRGVTKAFRHPGDLGDIIYGLPVIKARGGGKLFLENSMIWGREPMSKGRINFIKPLLEYQPYIHSVKAWEDEPSENMNFYREVWKDEIRKKMNTPRKSLAKRMCDAHNVGDDILKSAWLEVPKPKMVAEVVMARSPRYHGVFPWEEIVKKYRKRAVFVGLPEEHRAFEKRFGKVEYYPVTDALELARVIAGARLFIGNQSFPFAIAEGLKQNSILEVWPLGPDCLFPRPNSFPIEKATDRIPDLSEFVDIVKSETDKHRHLVQKYCKGNGVDLGSGGHPVVPWAIQVELGEDDYGTYNRDRPETPIQWRGDATKLPFQSKTLDWVHSSHLLEDFKNWKPILAEWSRCLKVGGYMMIAVPDHKRFRAAVEAGQGDNLAHKHESFVGELSGLLKDYEVIKDDFVNKSPREYSILFIGKKKGSK